MNPPAITTVRPAVTHEFAESLVPPVDQEPLSPEALLFFCQARMQELDSAIAKKMQGQQDLVALQGELTSIDTQMKNYATDGGGFNDEEKVNALWSAFDSAIAHAREGGNNALAKTLTDAQAKLRRGPSAEKPDNDVTPDEIKDLSATLDSALSNCRSGAELSMIELQSLVSKRATALQLTTGMMNSVDEGMKAVAGNIGR